MTSAIVHAHTPESRARQVTVCGHAFRDITGNHFLAMEWRHIDANCEACRAILDGLRPATAGAEFVDANGCEVSP